MVVWSSQSTPPFTLTTALTTPVPTRKTCADLFELHGLKYPTAPVGVSVRTGTREARVHTCTCTFSPVARTCFAPHSHARLSGFIEAACRLHYQYHEAAWSGRGRRPPQPLGTHPRASSVHWRVLRALAHKTASCSPATTCHWFCRCRAGSRVVPSSQTLGTSAATCCGALAKIRTAAHSSGTTACRTTVAVPPRAARKSLDRQGPNSHHCWCSVQRAGGQ